MNPVNSVLPVALVMGVVAGLLVGLYFNFFNVPVIEWAISLEEAAAGPEPGGLSVSLAAQRIGQVPATMVAGVLFGAIFTGLYSLVRRAAPGWNSWAWAVIAGLLGFWALSMLTQMKYPANPPGVGEEASLLMRQGFQFLFIFLSLAAVAAGCWAIRRLHQSGAAGMQRFLGYAGIGLAYVVAVIILAYVIPGNPDPMPAGAPPAMVILFRSFTLIGHLLLWVFIAVGVAGYIQYRERGIQAYPEASEANRGLPSARQP